MQEHTIPIIEVPAPIHSTSQPKPTHPPSIADDVRGHGINADHPQESPVFDRTPDGNYDLLYEVTPLTAVDVQGHFILLVCHIAGMPVSFFL